ELLVVVPASCRPELARSEKPTVSRTTDEPIGKAGPANRNIATAWPRSLWSEWDFHLSVIWGVCAINRRCVTGMFR
ncbi:hypothetical protein, partial [Mesorhizobium sp. M7A.F.Ca.CA.002.09.1.1]|uniref:hypothetical protein n=1 Tax=Mesorhizobium sp. M7A.F.Ca.CA.002.09.1.1 TaxID=2496739 RepID=UPI0019D21727